MDELLIAAAAAGELAIEVEIIGAPASFLASARRAFPQPTSLRATEAASSHRRPAPALVLLHTRDAPTEREVRALASQAPTVVVADSTDVAQALDVLDWGADGYLDAAVEPAALRAAVIGVLRGELAFPRIVIGISLRRQRARSSATSRVTARQREILDLIAAGATDKDIAAVFKVRVSTAQKQVSRLLRQLGARNRAAAVARVAGGRRGN